MTSHHEGVSCNSCRKTHIRGLRYKCLICYDYDLCSSCYEARLTSSRHTVNHPMQCIVAKDDYDLFYAGESVTSDRPISLTCPLCGTLGFAESNLLEHVTNEHGNTDADESSAGLVCPICGVETNQLTYDFATHLTMEHRAQRETIEQVNIRGRGGRCHSRTTGPRGRRPQTHYSATSAQSGSPSTREPLDPLVDILTQLTNVRRAGGVGNQSAASQLHNLHMHLQSSPSFSARTSNEVRIMRRTFQSMNNQLNATSTSTSTGPAGTSAGPGIYSNTSSHYCSTQPSVLMDQPTLTGFGLIPSAVGGVGGVAGALNAAQQANGLGQQLNNETGSTQSSQYLLSRCMKPMLTETEQQQKEILRADRSLFVQDLLLQLGLLEQIQ